MKRFAMLITSLYISSMTPTTIYIPPETQLTITPDTSAPCPVDTGTACSPPAVSTGPFTLRVSTDPASDCYTAKGVNSNGTLISEQWMKCPQ